MVSISNSPVILDMYPSRETFYIYTYNFFFLHSVALPNNDNAYDESQQEKEKRYGCHSTPSSFEIRALMIPCNVNYCPCSNLPGQNTIPKPPDFSNQIPEDSCKLSNFTKKLVLTVKMTNMGVTDCKNQYVVVDHVYDPTSEHKQRLLYPYVLKIKQKPLMQTYVLTKESSVNEKSTELVINKNDKDYKGCNTVGEETTCQKVMYEGKRVPYSAGFCCSCDDEELRTELDKFDKDQKLLEKTIKRNDEVGKKIEKRSLDEKQTTDPFESFSLKKEQEDAKKELHELDRILNTLEQCEQAEKKKRMKMAFKSRPSKITIKKAPVRNFDNECSEPLAECSLNETLSENEFDDKDETEDSQDDNNGNTNANSTICDEEDQVCSPPFIHPRGGQNCSDKKCPPNVDLYKYQQSTHCLTFSKLWYSVFKLEKPTIIHEISLEIYEKHEDLSGHVIWRDITKGKPLTIGTTKSEDSDDKGTFWAGYIGQTPLPHSFSLDSDVHRLLVPEPLEPCQSQNYPELKGGPYEWLVIPNYMITSDGSKCDKVGVGYEAFVKQPDRCSKPRGTCLRNQPKDFWCHDHRLEQMGQIGSYFLKYFGFIPRCPIENSTEEDGSQNLRLYYRQAYTSTINIELKTDYNLVLRPHAAVVITEVYVDSTNFIKSTITVKVTNSGLVYGVFFVALTDCPMNMPASFNNIQTKSVLISPQHQHVFVIEIMCPLPEKNIHCSIEARNVRAELLAFRRIRFQRSDRCICIWHCVCTCLETDGGLSCQPLPFDHYNAAGFHGGLPEATDYVQFTLLEELMTVLYHLFLTMTLILVVFGIIKGIIGIFYKPIGEWGLCSMLGLPKPMKNYHEKSLKGREVVYDLYGWPIHPDTKKRVRNASFLVEFCINTIFFLIYPLVMINVIVKRMCFVDATNESDRRPCCLCGQVHDTGECPSLGILRGLGIYRCEYKRREGYVKKKKKKSFRDVSIQYTPPQSINDDSIYY